MDDTRCSRGRDRGHIYARVALLVGLALLAIAACLTLTEHPVSVVKTNGVPLHGELSSLSSGSVICQGGESLPADTAAIRLSLFALVGPHVELRASSGGRILTRGTRGPGWTAGAVTIPVARLPHAASGVTICATLGQSVRSVSVAGHETTRDPASTNGGWPLAGRMRVEYLRPSRATWWSSALAVARRMGLGHAAPGTWVALLVAALMAFAGAIACRLVLADPCERRAQLWDARRLILRTAGPCALVACLSAVSWSLITPPFQAPDEPDHYAYVEQLAATGRLPTPGAGSSYSSQLSLALQGLGYYEVRGHPQVQTIATDAEQRLLERDLAVPASQTDGAVGVSASEPPLYYALEAVPYELSANVLGRLELMRLLSALFAGVTALFVVLFLREALPGTPWAWTVGGLGVALAPLLGFISGAVNPDAMLAAVSAALFYCIARGLRRGLTLRLAGAVGAVMAVGLLTKLNFIGLFPGGLLGLVVLAVREARTSTARAVRALLLAVAIAAAPIVAYALVNVLSGDPTLGLVSRAPHLTRGSIVREISYIWQFYLPRLPGMSDYFPGILTTRDIWFDRTVGLYGWLDTVFPGWVYDVALIPTAVIGGLCIRALLASRVSLRRRAVELAVYGAMAVGELVLVGADSYIQAFEPQGELFAEPRYLLPMIAILGATLALAARGARRWMPVAGTLIVVAVFAHDLFSQLQVIARYHG
jgi:4-amino-4-deoxy-L-arabinose transferase-like glycosyltransferase